jgi:hypothetical protein
MSRFDRSLGYFGILLVAGAGVAAGGCVDGPRSDDVTLTSAVVTTRTLTLPADVSLRAAALAATDSMRLADRVQVLTPTGRGATVSSVGPAETNIGMESVTGDLWSKGPVVLRGTNQSDFFNVRGNLRTGGTVTCRTTPPSSSEPSRTR